MRRSIVTALLVGALTQRAIAQPSTAPSFGAAPGEAAPHAADDMAQAADATADVAAVPTPPAAVEPGAPQASSDDIDLSALGLDPAAAVFDDALNIYGFADVGWFGEHWMRASTFLPSSSRTFSVGNLNLYFAKNLTPRWRALAEVRFTFLPNGSQNADGTVVNTTALDATNYYRPVQWGGVVIERAYIEYDLTTHLTLRGGHWLTPYGIWNIDHGSPVFLGAVRPFIIGEQFFPEHQTGLDLFGSHYERGFKLTYHATLSNGRGDAEAQIDQDLNPGLGGQLQLETPWGLKLGTSFYRGRFTGFPATPGGAGPTYLEAAYGADAQFVRGGLHLQAEVIARERRYEVGARVANGAGFSPDGRDFGAYLLAGYRTEHLWNVMPFIDLQHYRPADHPYLAGVDAYNLGLNFRPTASLVLKIHGSYGAFVDGPQLLAGQTLLYLATQACWMF